MNLSDCLALIECPEPGKLVRDAHPNRPVDGYTNSPCYDLAEAAIRLIAPLVNSVIVVVTPADRHWLAAFADLFPGKVTPGLKGNIVAGDNLISLAKWRTLHTSATQAAELCGSDVCYVDFESALAAYWADSTQYLLLDAVSDAIRLTFGQPGVKLMAYGPQYIYSKDADSGAITKAFADGMKPGDSFAPGFLSSKEFPELTHDRYVHQLLTGPPYYEQLLVSMTAIRGRYDCHDPASVLKTVAVVDSRYLHDTIPILNLPAADCIAVAKEINRLATAATTTTEKPKMIKSNRIVGRFAVNFKKCLVAMPYVGPPAYREIGPVLWANKDNGGGGQTIYLRQVGNKAICRVMLPIETEPYWIIPELGVGTLYGPHALEGTNGFDLQAMGAAFSDEMLPLTIHKRSIAEPTKIETSEMGIWLDYEVPLMGNVMEPETIFVVNLHCYRVLAS